MHSGHNSAMPSAQADDHKFEVSLGYIVRHCKERKGRKEKEKKEGTIWSKPNHTGCKFSVVYQ